MKLKNILILACAAIFNASADVAMNFGAFGHGALRIPFGKNQIDQIQQLDQDEQKGFDKNKLDELAAPKDANALPISAGFAINASVIAGNWEVGLCFGLFGMPDSTRTIDFNAKQGFFSETNEVDKLNIKISQSNFLFFGPQIAYVVEDLVTIRLMVGITPSQKMFMPKKTRQNIYEKDNSIALKIFEESQDISSDISYEPDAMILIHDNLMISIFLNVNVCITDGLSLMILLGAGFSVMDNVKNKTNLYVSGNPFQFDISNHFGMLAIGLNFQIG